MSGLPVLSLDLTLSAIQNLTVISALILVYHFIPKNSLLRTKNTFPIWIGIIFGSIAVISAPFLWEIGKGTNAPVVGVNIVLIPLAALIAGPFASCIVTGMILAEIRLLTSTFPILDVITVISLFFVSSLFYYGRSWKRFPKSLFIQLFILGLVVALIEAFFFSFFLAGSRQITFSLSGISQVFVILPFLVVSWSGTIILGSLTAYIDRKRDAEEELRQRYEELAQSSRRIRENEASIASIFRVAPIGIAFISGRTINRVNDRFCEITGYSREELMGKDTRFLYLNDDEYARIGDANIATETRWKRKDGAARDVLLTGILIDPSNTGAGRVFTALDITERERTQKALDHAKEKLNLLNFVTFRDIQNQVFTVLGYLQLAATEVPKAGSSVSDEMLEKEISVLQKISDSLKFAQTYQDLGLKPARWQNVHQVFLLAISHLDFQKINHTSTLGNLEIFADPMLEKVFQILADNTIAHSKTGTAVSLTYVKGADDTLTVIFADDGVGIPYDDKERIFIPDFQKEKPMGLFLAKEILETTNITLRETGIPGKGVRFEMHMQKDGYRFSG